MPCPSLEQRRSLGFTRVRSADYIAFTAHFVYAFIKLTTPAAILSPSTTTTPIDVLLSLPILSSYRHAVIIPMALSERFLVRPKSRHCVFVGPVRVCFTSSLIGRYRWFPIRIKGLTFLLPLHYRKHLFMFSLACLCLLPNDCMYYIIVSSLVMSENFARLHNVYISPIGFSDNKYD